MPDDLDAPCCFELGGLPPDKTKLSANVLTYYLVLQSPANIWFSLLIDVSVSNAPALLSVTYTDVGKESESEETNSMVQAGEPNSRGGVKITDSVR